MVRKTEANESIDKPRCCRCKENFPVAKDQTAGWLMGLLRELRHAPKKIREDFAPWADASKERYLCGNCYFDLTDDL
jgi:hypothetical protein